MAVHVKYFIAFRKVTVVSCGIYVNDGKISFEVQVYYHDSLEWSVITCLVPAVFSLQSYREVDSLLCVIV